MTVREMKKIKMVGSLIVEEEGKPIKRNGEREAYI